MLYSLGPYVELKSAWRSTFIMTLISSFLVGMRSVAPHFRWNEKVLAKSETKYLLPG